MNKSESIKNIAGALAVFHKHVGKVSKDATNPFFKKKYASLSNILEAMAEPLEKSGLVFSQFPTDNNGLSTIVMHAESGEWMESTYIMPVARENDPQAVGSALTYARRYALSAAFGINVDDDDDGNKGSGKTEDKKPTAKTPEPPKADKKPESLLIEYTGDIAKEIDDCTTAEQVSAVWVKYIPLQKNPDFIKDIKNKGEFLKLPAATK